MKVFEVEDRVTVNHKGTYKGIRVPPSGIKVTRETRFSDYREDGSRVLLEIEVAITSPRACLPFN